jgi:hypothetical protein
LDADMALFKSIYAVLGSFDGADRFKIRVPNGSGTVELEFPNATTRYCVGLARQLEAMLGDGHLVAEQLPERPAAG